MELLTKELKEKLPPRNYSGGLETCQSSENQVE